MSGKMIILVLALLIFVSFPAAGEVYTVYLDREFGFWAIRSNDLNQSLNYSSRTLNIDTGDSVQWMNMDSEGERITIMSDNTLWEGGKMLGGPGNRFRFTFNSSGIYRFHIVENTRVNLNISNYSETRTLTTLTYEDDDGEIHTITISRDESSKLKDVMDTQRYSYQQQTIRVSGQTIGNGTGPARTAQRTLSPFIAAIRPAIQVNALPTPTIQESMTQELIMQAVVAKAVSKPLESYQEFTIYEVLKRWMTIIETG